MIHQLGNKPHNAGLQALNILGFPKSLAVAWSLYIQVKDRAVVAAFSRLLTKKKKSQQMGAEVIQIQSGIRNNLPSQKLIKLWNSFSLKVIDFFQDKLLKVDETLFKRCSLNHTSLEVLHKTHCQYPGGITSPLHWLQFLQLYMRVSHLFKYYKANADPL